MKTKLLIFTILITGSAMAQIPTNGLVGNYQFNANANDASANNNNGVVSNAVQTADRFGNANSAYHFNGTNSKITIPHSSSLTFSSNAITVAFWAKTLSVPSNGYNGIIVSKQSGSGATQQGFNIADNTNMDTYLLIRNGSGGVFGSADGAGTVILNTYHHYVFTYDNGTGNCYFDGVLISAISGQAGIIGANTMDLLIGQANWSNINAKNYHGIIDELLIYDRAITATEVTQIYTTTGCDITISSQPINSSINAGNSTSFTFSATGSNINYQWQSNTGSGFSNILDDCINMGTGTTVLSLPLVSNTMNNNSYRCIVSNNVCADTTNSAMLLIDTTHLIVYDTTHVTAYDTTHIITNDTSFYSVSDTLIINALLTTGISQNTINTLKLYPNPTNDYLYIDYGTYSTMSGYTLEIKNSLGQTVYTTGINQQSDYINLSSWTGNGIYFAHIIDANNSTIEIKKIILQ